MRARLLLALAAVAALDDGVIESDVLSGLRLVKNPTLQHRVTECVTGTKDCPGMFSKAEVDDRTGLATRVFDWRVSRLTDLVGTDELPTFQMPERAAGFVIDSPSSSIKVSMDDQGVEMATDAVFFHTSAIADVELVGIDVEVDDHKFQIRDLKELQVAQKGRQPVRGDGDEHVLLWRHTVKLPGASVVKLIPWWRFPCGPRKHPHVIKWRLRFKFDRVLRGGRPLALAWHFGHQLILPWKRCCRIRAPRTKVDAVGTSFVDSSISVPRGQLVEWTNLNPGHNVVQIVDPTTTPNQCSALPSGFRSSYYGDWDYDFLGSSYTYKKAMTVAGMQHYMCEPHCSTGGMRASVSVQGLKCMMQWGWGHEGDGTCVYYGTCAGAVNAPPFTTELMCLRTCCSPLSCLFDESLTCPPGYVRERKGCCYECVEQTDPCASVDCTIYPPLPCTTGWHATTSADGCCEYCEEDPPPPPPPDPPANCTYRGELKLHGALWPYHPLGRPTACAQSKRECECVNGTVYCCNVYRELHTLSAADRLELAEAFRVANGGAAPGNPSYINMVTDHDTYFGPAHGHPWFLPWHRGYHLNINEVLQQHQDYVCVAIPYWDWTIDSGQTPASGTIPTFDAATFGTTGTTGQNGVGFGNCVADGSFAAGGFWLPATSGWVSHPPGCLQRTLSMNSPTYYATSTTVGNVITNAGTTGNFNSGWQSIRAGLEGGPHNTPHTSTGGHMTTSFSPYDPIFFFHHNMIDQLWDVWQRLSPANQYAFDEEPSTGQLLHATMDGVGATAADVLVPERMCYKQLDREFTTDSPICYCGKFGRAPSAPGGGNTGVILDPPRLDFGKGERLPTWFIVSKLPGRFVRSLPSVAPWKPPLRPEFVVENKRSEEVVRKVELQERQSFWLNTSDPHSVADFLKLRAWAAAGGHQSAWPQATIVDDFWSLDPEKVDDDNKDDGDDDDDNKDDGNKDDGDKSGGNKDDGKDDGKDLPDKPRLPGGGVVSVGRRRQMAAEAVLRPVLPVAPKKRRYGYRDQLVPSLDAGEKGVVNVNGQEVNGVIGTNGIITTNGIIGTNGIITTNGIIGTNGIIATNGIVLPNTDGTESSGREREDVDDPRDATRPPSMDERLGLIKPLLPRTDTRLQQSWVWGTLAFDAASRIGTDHDYNDLVLSYNVAFFPYKRQIKVTWLVLSPWDDKTALELQICLRDRKRGDTFSYGDGKAEYERPLSATGCVKVGLKPGSSRAVDAEYVVFFAAAIDAHLDFAAGPPSYYEPPATCLYGGQEYQPGDEFRGQGPHNWCNTCRCRDDGTVMCTRIYCEARSPPSLPPAPPGICKDGYNVYEPGDQWRGHGDNWCNTCFCQDDGTVSCTEMDCDERPPSPPTAPAVCQYGENEYTVGDRFDGVGVDWCNKCQCQTDGEVWCTKKGCPPPVCMVEGKEYKPGQRWKGTGDNHCNTCYCARDGTVQCTKKTCLPIKPPAPPSQPCDNIDDGCDLDDDPPLPPSCPAKKPEAGSQCRHKGQRCDYDLICCPNIRRCVNTTFAACTEDKDTRKLAWAIAIARPDCTPDSDNVVDKRKCEAKGGTWVFFVDANKKAYCKMPEAFGRRLKEDEAQARCLEGGGTWVSGVVGTRPYCKEPRQPPNRGAVCAKDKDCSDGLMCCNWNAEQGRPGSKGVCNELCLFGGFKPIVIDSKCRKTDCTDNKLDNSDLGGELLEAGCCCSSDGDCASTKCDYSGTWACKPTDADEKRECESGGGVWMPLLPPSKTPYCRNDKKRECESIGGTWVADNTSKAPYCKRPQAENQQECEAKGGRWVIPPGLGGTPFCHEADKPDDDNDLPRPAPRFRCLNFPTAHVPLPREGNSIFEVYPTLRKYLSRDRCPVVADGFYMDRANRYGHNTYAAFSQPPRSLPRLSGGSLVETIEGQARTESNRLSKAAAKEKKMKKEPEPVRPRPLPPAACKMTRADVGRGCACKFEWGGKSTMAENAELTTSEGPVGLILDCPA